MGVFSRLYMAEMAHNFRPGDEVKTRHHGSGVVHSLDGRHNVIVSVKDGENERKYSVPHNQVERNT